VSDDSPLPSRQLVRRAAFIHLAVIALRRSELSREAAVQPSYCRRFMYSDWTMTAV
jgi:hypothetical protein